MEEAAMSSDEQDIFHERYAAFGLQFKQLFAVKAKLSFAKAKAAAAQNLRYTAYTSDVGEAFRPVVPTWAVRGTYGLAISYIFGEIGLTTYREHEAGGDAARAFAHAALFQGVASLALPMVIIHQTVHAAQAVTKRIGRFTKWGPTIAGLALIPALPYAIDEPCEIAIDNIFEQIWPAAEAEAERRSRLGKKQSSLSYVLQAVRADGAGDITGGTGSAAVEGGGRGPQQGE